MQQPKYDMVRIIGSGVFGTSTLIIGYVFEVQNRETKKKAALKRIEKQTGQLSREYEILVLIQGSPNVVKLEVLTIESKDMFFTKKENKVIQNMVFEFVEDNLESLIERNVKAQTKIKEITIKIYMYQVLNGLSWIHSKKVCHRDLKPENVLLSKTGTIKICDFGSSKIVSQKTQNTPYIVSRYYRAPELIMCISKYSVEIDIWAAGCILAELFLLFPFFKGKTEGDQLFKVFKTLGSFTPQELKEYKSQVPFDTGLLKEFENYERKDLNEIFHMVEDRKNFIDLLLKMLCLSPTKRITAAQAMNHPFFEEIQKQEHEAKLKAEENTDANEIN